MTGDREKEPEDGNGVNPDGGKALLGCEIGVPWLDLSETMAESSTAEEP